MRPASAASVVTASTTMRPGSTMSNNTSRASTIWPLRMFALAMTPDAGARRASLPPTLPDMARSRPARLASSARAASISFCGTVPSSDSSRLTRCSASGGWRDIRQRRLLVGAVDGAGDRTHLREDLAFRYALAGDRQAVGAGFDAAGKGRLHAAAGIRVDADAAVQLDRQRLLGFFRHHGPDSDAALGELGHIDAAVGQARQAASTAGSGSVQVLPIRAMGAGSSQGRRRKQASGEERDDQVDDFLGHG